MRTRTEKMKSLKHYSLYWGLKFLKVEQKAKLLIKAEYLGKLMNNLLFSLQCVSLDCVSLQCTKLLFTQVLHQTVLVYTDSKVIYFILGEAK